MNKVAVLSGDGIGPEVMEQAIRVLDKAAGIFDFELAFEYSYNFV